MSDPMEYPDGTVVRIEDFGPIELAYTEAMHEDCDAQPPGHPLAEHSPWSGGDFDGTEPWSSFVERLARHGLALVAAPSTPEPSGLREAAQAVVDRAHINLERWYKGLDSLPTLVSNLEAVLREPSGAEQAAPSTEPALDVERELDRLRGLVMVYEPVYNAVLAARDQPAVAAALARLAESQP